MTVEIRRADDRFRTQSDWLDSRHSFSFGPYYDPANVGFGLLMVHNDEVVAPGTGFDTHPHQDVEIVTWVLRGALLHQDSEGHSGLIYPGLVQRMSAGSGIQHSERNDAGDPVRYVQMWVRPGEYDLTPSYQQAEVAESLATGELVPIASGLRKHKGTTAITINQPRAGLSVARLAPGQSTQLPPAPHAHLFVALGNIAVESAGHLAHSDAARITNADGQRVTAGPEGAEVLLWEMTD
ncbi:pirin family protein [Streptomyces sp. SID13031]|uniref:pirin family protein n=1 Tax=Streptomyces sp. SID13031 TaxID=2706046 RepID=UPI0013C5C3C0|nr:pirin family protein [Streptomyces sp. SID13031]NEA36169.1 pirin family protein [Streptomyces sp. SID13031]